MNESALPDLNLARKWRPKSFDQIVGQEIPVRMLKNSLYLKKFFPVYLFAGQRGCGKTSTARVFAAAINCEKLQNFQQDPSVSIPCMSCSSCRSIAGGSHPDFIEIDAASHTGVDNVRQIIDSSSYMPLMGQKKIYLIDEAHMLSKAAFNAFLKILEEPPASVLFILATTELHKVPTTILSRCFQVIFTALESGSLKDHLRAICLQEKIDIDDAAITLLFNETEGSARDAINLLERVRFSGEHITQDVVLQVLGKLSNKEIFELFSLILDRQPDLVISKLQTMSFESLAPQILWDTIVQLCRALLWIKYKVKDISGSFSGSVNELKQLAAKCSMSRLQAILQLLWTQEELFLKTNKKHLFLEMVLLEMCEQVNVVDLENLILAAKQSPSRSFSNYNNLPQNNVLSVVEHNVAPEKNNEVEVCNVNSESSVALEATPWQLFLQELNGQDDQFLSSILLQSRFIEIRGNALAIQLRNDSSFLRDKITESQSIWQSLLAKYFQGVTKFEIEAGSMVVEPELPVKSLEKIGAASERPPESVISRPQGRSDAYRQASTNRGGYQASSGRSYGGAPTRVENKMALVDIADKAKWPLANLIVSHFPGKIKTPKDN